MARVVDNCVPGIYKGGVSGLSVPGSSSSTRRPPGRYTLVLWLVTAALTGAIVMSLELAGFRLFAPYFGYSLYVWGSMISVILLALSIGYALGGWLADRSGSALPLYCIVLASGIYQLAIAFTVHGILVWLWLRSEFVASTTASLIIFGPPMTGLAMTSPYLIRLLAREGHVGATAGLVYSLSTAGSILGIVATSFYLVPHLGTRATLEILCGSSLVVGAAGIASGRTVAGIASIAPLTALFLVPAARLSPRVVWHTESAYNWVAVVRSGGTQSLILNDPHYAQTFRSDQAGWAPYYFEDFALGPLLVPSRTLLVLGLGAGGSWSAAKSAAPQLETDAVEIDPAVVEAAARYFGVPRDSASLRIHIADARPWLAHGQERFDLVHVDLYQGGPYIPFYLTTVEFFRQVRERMSEDSLLMMNVYNPGEDRALSQAAGATLQRVFPTVLELPRSDGNQIFFAFTRERWLEEVRSRLLTAQGSAEVRERAQTSAKALIEFSAPRDTVIFTDDRAPVEQLTRRVLVAIGR